MKNLATILEYQGKPYFAITKDDKIILMEDFFGRFMKGEVLSADDCIHYEILRNGSILISGDVFYSDYFRTVVFHVGYSELSSYRGFIDSPPNYFSARHFQKGDEICVDKVIPGGAMYDSIMTRLGSRNALRDNINASIERFLEKCRRSNIQVTLAPFPPEPALFKDYPGNIRILSYHALWNHAV